MSNLPLPSWLTSARSIAIVGYGREGKSTHEFLKKFVPNVPISIYENQERFDLGAVQVVFKSPGIYRKKIQMHPSAYLTSQADLALQMYGPQVIGITGTKGKSTTAHAIHYVLSMLGEKSMLVGNIGTPVLDMVENITAQTHIVFELSSFQTESLHVGPHIGVFTSLYQDHLDYYESMQEYEFAKKHLFDLLSAQDLCIYREEYPRIKELLAACRAKKLSYTKTSHAYPVNYMPARLIAREYGYSDAQIDQALATIQPLPGRLEVVAVRDGVRFIDDALATIPEATIDAFETLGSDVAVLIAGGHDRGQDFSQLAKRIEKSSLRAVILFPTTGERIAQALRDLDARVALVFVNSMDQAVSKAFQYAKDSLETCPAPIVLLSAASPSFGLFANYQDRSARYREAIARM